MKFFKVDSPICSNEDAKPVVNSKMIIVCDGLGATGQNKHEINGHVHTSAYLGSRFVSTKAEVFFTSNENRSWYDDPIQICQEFKEYLTKELEDYICSNHLQKTIRGKSAELLPTTLAMAVFKENEEDIDILAIWAGDSRVYLLSSNEGLQQITQDDVVGDFDAMESLGSSNMCNNISGEGNEKFYLNYRQYKVKKQSNLFLFASSDGCFDYLATPMDFEYLFELAIDRLPETGDISSLEEKISEFYCGNNLKDDSTMAGVIFGETDLGGLKRQYEKRYKSIIENYRMPTEEYLVTVAKCEDEINATLLEVNKTFRDLCRQIVTYASNVLDGKYLDIGSRHLKEQICSLPCMSGYNKMIHEQSKKIEEQKALLGRANRDLQSIENDMVGSFFKEFISMHLKDKKYSIGYRQIYTSRYRNKKTAKTEADDFLQAAEKDVFRILENMRRYIAEEEHFAFANENKNLHNITLRLKEIEKRVFKDDSYDEQKLYQLASDELLKSGEAEYELNAARRNGFKNYPGTQEIARKCEQIKLQINSYNETLNKLKESGGSFNFINSIASEFVNAFIEIQDLEKCLWLDLYNKIQQYKKLCEKQNNGRKLINQKHQDIDSLWREKYKNTYELYNRAISGGKV